MSLKTKDNHIIYGTRNSKKKSKKILILIHGLTGNQSQHIFHNAVPYFTAKSFDTFRCDLYTSQPKGRALSECGIDTHAQDLNTIIAHFSKIYTEVYLAGHSLGATAIMLANIKNPKVKKIVFWDPAYICKDHASIRYDKRIGKHIIHRGVESLLSKELVQQRAHLSDLAKKITKPTKFIFAYREGLKDLRADEIKKIKGEHAKVVISNASHCFDEEGTEKKLFQETYKRIK